MHIIIIIIIIIIIYRLQLYDLMYFAGLLNSFFFLFLFTLIGCSRSAKKSPISHFHYQKFNFSSYLAYHREKTFLEENGFLRN